MNALKIMVVVDEAFFSGMLVRFIQQIAVGIPVEARTSVLESLITDKGGWLPDVLLIDLDIPGLKKLHRILKARKVFPGALIIVMGNFNDDSYRALAIANGADDFLDKNDLTHRLFPTIQQHLGLKISV